MIGNLFRSLRRLKNVGKIRLSKSFGVYQIRNTATGGAYIGSTTKSFTQRWSQWRMNLNRGSGCNPHLRYAWEKYGPESFEFSILEVVEDATQVLIREQYWIDQLKPYYNICPTAGNRAGSKHSEETRQKMSQARVGKPIHTEESRMKIGEANRGRLKTPEQIEKHRSKIKGQSNLALKGKPLSEEHKAKLRIARASRMTSEETRRKISESLRGNDRRWGNHRRRTS